MSCDPYHVTLTKTDRGSPGPCFPEILFSVVAASSRCTWQSQAIVEAFRRPSAPVAQPQTKTPICTTSRVDDNIKKETSKVNQGALQGTRSIRVAAAGAKKYTLCFSAQRPDRWAIFSSNKAQTSPKQRRAWKRQRVAKTNWKHG